MDLPAKDGEPVVVLLVEDETDHAELVMRSFREHHVANDIRHVSDGQAALDYLFRQGKFSDPESSPRPHLVVLDLRLPKVDGLEVLRQVKQCDKLADVPVVVLTTSQAEKDIAAAYDYRANSYVVKPLDFDNFHQLVRDLGFYWLAWNRAK